jgi:hypothetical protein
MVFSRPLFTPDGISRGGCKGADDVDASTEDRCRMRILIPTEVEVIKGRHDTMRDHVPQAQLCKATMQTESAIIRPL